MKYEAECPACLTDFTIVFEEGEGPAEFCPFCGDRFDYSDDMLAGTREGE